MSCPTNFLLRDDSGTLPFTLLKKLLHFRFLAGITAVCLLLAVAACSPRTLPPAAERSALSESDTPADSVLAYMQHKQGTGDSAAARVEAIKGRAAARVSMPGSSEQATLRFTSGRQQSLLSFRNNLGIEGGRIYADADSVLMYDRIEKTAQKMSIERSRYILLNGFTAFNVITLLLPDICMQPAPQVFEDEQKWLLITADDRQYEIQKDSGMLSRVEHPADDPLAYNQFIFSEYAQIDGIRLPRRIQILSKDEESSIFLVVQALEINPEHPDFDPNLPDDISIERF